MSVYKKSELTQYAKRCARASDTLMTGVCYADELSRSEICKEILDKDNEELLLEISKRFAKYANDQNVFHYENQGFQDFHELINAIINCCDENNLFIERG